MADHAAETSGQRSPECLGKLTRMIEVNECLTRLVGQENTLLWMGLYPERLGACINRIGEFYLACCKAAIRAAAGCLDGFVIWGDVAYRKSLFFSPGCWREYFKPWVKAMVEHCHAHGLPVIYHGCGNLDVQKWERGDREEIRAEILRKLNAAKGGGLIFQSDRSVTSGVSGRTYDYIVKLIREHGTFRSTLANSAGISTKRRDGPAAEGRPRRPL